VPITPYTDSQPAVRQPYQLAHLVARQAGTGQVLAETPIVAPVSDEMACANCQHDGDVDVRDIMLVARWFGAVCQV
jgi:hypothetical protein